MLEEESLSSSFFEPVQLGAEQLSESDIPDVQAFSFKPDLNLNINSINNPWDPPSSGTDISSVLSDVPLPEIYATAFAFASPNTGTVSVSTLHRILSISEIPHATIEKILNLAAPNSTRVNRGEFNVAIALVALAQKHMDVSIENLIEHKQDLPEPILNNLESIKLNRGLSFSAISSRPPALPSLQAEDPWALSNNGYTEYIEPSSSFVPTTVTSVTQPVTENLTSVEDFQWFLDMDVITIKFAPEREGFLFKHVNYIVESQKRETTVVRRYSDFWWLMECLVKRYPFRILPALPPKKIGVNGFYFTVDESFLEKRKKGLARFLNFITRHPILKDDYLVEMFLTEQSIAEWRKNNIPDLEEEYVKRQIPHEMEARIPDNLNERLDKVYKKLDDTIDHYRNMCNLMERIARRQEGMATDYMRYSLALNSLIEKEKGCYIEDCYSCTQVVHGLEQVSSHFQRTSTVMEDVANATLDIVLENLKRHRDLLVSFRETFERKDRLVVDTSEALNNRIKANKTKLIPLDGKEGMEQEIERLKNAIEKDEEDIRLQQKRKLFVRYCLYAELTLFHKSTAFISLLYQNFVNDQIKYSQQLYENWKSLSPKVYDMPIETNGFG